MAREMTNDEVRTAFLNHVRQMVEWWDNEDRAPTSKEKLVGLAFSILAELDESLLDRAGELRWTTERPTKPGWYHAQDNCGREVVYARGDGSLLRADHRFSYSVDMFTHFAGPIPEPEGGVMANREELLTICFPSGGEVVEVFGRLWKHGPLTNSPGSPYAVGVESNGGVIMFDPRVVITGQSSGVIYNPRDHFREFSRDMREWMQKHPDWPSHNVNDPEAKTPST